MMKKIIIIISLFFIWTKCSEAQVIWPKTTPLFQQSGNSTTWGQNNGIFYPVVGLVLPTYIDTLTANNNPYIKLTPFCMIATSDGRFWVRSFNAQKWLEFAQTSGVGTVTSVSGLSPLFTVTNATTTPTFSLSNTTAYTVFGRAASTGVPSYLSLDTNFISGFSAKVRPLFSAGTGITYNSVTGVITNSSPASLINGTNGVTRVGNDIQLGGTLTSDVLIDADGNDFTVDNSTNLVFRATSSGNTSSMNLTNTATIGTSKSGGTILSDIIFYPDSLKLRPSAGVMFIDSVTASDTGQYVLGWNANGRVVKTLKSSIVGVNLYNSNGSLTSARTVTMGSNALIFDRSGVEQLTLGTALTQISAPDGVKAIVIPNTGSPFTVTGLTSGVGTKAMRYNPATGAWTYVDTTIASSAIKIADTLIIANVLNYGADPSGTNGSALAFRNAVASGRAVYVPPGRYKINGVDSAITLGSNQTIYGVEGQSELFTTTNGSTASPAQGTAMYFIILSGDRSTVNGLTFSGNGKTTYVFPWVSQNAVWVTGNFNTVINCKMRQLRGAAIVGLHPSLSLTKENTAINNNIDTCTVGYFTYANSEYWTISNSHVTGCDIGVRESGANNNYSTVNFTYNTTNGVFVGNGANSDHSYVTNCVFNHGSGKNLDIDDNAISLTFTNCGIWSATSTIDQSVGVSFNGCQFGASANMTVTAATTTKTTYFYNCYVGYTPAPVFAESGTGKIVQVGSYNQTDSVYRIRRAASKERLAIGDSAWSIGNLKVYAGTNSVGDSLKIQTGFTSIDTTNFKPLAENSNGVATRMTYWPGSGGSGASPTNTLGDIIYRGVVSDTLLHGNTSTTRKVYTSTGNGTIAAAPRLDTAAIISTAGGLQDYVVTYTGVGQNFQLAAPPRTDSVGTVQFVVDSSDYGLYNGDSIYTSSYLAGKWYDVYRVGRLQSTDSAFGITRDTAAGTWTVHPPAEGGEQFITKVYVARSTYTVPLVGNWRDLTFTTNSGLVNTSGVWSSTNPGFTGTGLDSKNLQGNGSVRIQYLNAGVGGSFIGFNATNANEQYANWEYGIYLQTGGTVAPVVAGVIGSDLSPGLSIGQYVRLNRIGSTFTIGKSSDGITWTVIYTFGPTSSATHYVNMATYDALGRVYYPQGLNLK